MPCAALAMPLWDVAPDGTQAQVPLALLLAAAHPAHAAPPLELLRVAEGLRGETLAAMLGGAPLHEAPVHPDELAAPPLVLPLTLYLAPLLLLMLFVVLLLVLVPLRLWVMTPGPLLQVWLGLRGFLELLAMLLLLLL